VLISRLIWTLGSVSDDLSLLLKFRAPLMLECEQSRTVTLGIAAHAPVEGGTPAQRVVPLAASGAVTQYHRRSRGRQSLALPVRLIIARLVLAYLPELLVC